MTPGSFAGSKPRGSAAAAGGRPGTARRSACHAAAVLARSRWTSAADENAPIDAVARSTTRTAAGRPAVDRAAKGEQGDEPAAAGGDPARAAEGQRDEADRGQPGGDPGQGGDGGDERVRPAERSGAARAADAALAEEVRPAGGDHDHDEIEDEPPGGDDRAGSGRRRGPSGRLPAVVPGSAVTIRSPTAIAATTVAAATVARSLPTRG